MDLATLREYISLHIISLEQDIERLKNEDGYSLDLFYLDGVIGVSEHYLKVMQSVDTIEKLDSFKKNSGVVIDYIGD